MVRPVVQAKHPGLLRVPPTGSSGFRQQPTGQEEQDRGKNRKGTGIPDGSSEFRERDRYR
jgi:hypothetical protein